MKQATLLIVKFLVTWLVLAVMFGALGIVYQPVWLYAAILTVIAYAIGDVYILRLYGNLVAAVSDVVLAALVLWVSMALFNPARGQVPTMSLGQALSIGVVIGIVELFYHAFVASQLHYHYGRVPSH